MYCFTDKWVWGPVLGLPQCFIAMFTIQHISGLRGLHCAWALPRILLAWVLVCLCFCLSLKPTPLYCGIYSRAITVLDIMTDTSIPGIPNSGWWIWIFQCLIHPKMLLILMLFPTCMTFFFFCGIKKGEFMKHIPATLFNVWSCQYNAVKLQNKQKKKGQIYLYRDNKLNLKIKWINYETNSISEGNSVVVHLNLNSVLFRFSLTTVNVAKSTIKVVHMVHVLLWCPFWIF